ncbi:nuclear transport factor 2 family protein [Polaribacter sp. BAL334]|uniref:nuclear transport factor 2 family protein n=1 Tax=Polaribacter sp. BAL334 TaxID=1708178 RepID=UPI0018D20DEE|nr:nuclear transport factor 2 family protein [Polaribacter sp. BAL334]MBG7612000.1 nuclear transport factor 2 family protein [Polaribacter sp. BAL334]
MKKIISLVLLFILMVSCEKSVVNLSDSEKKQQKQIIESFLNEWHLAASQANYANYFDKMAENSVFIGTDASEIWSKKQFENYSKPHFDKGKAWDFKALERNIYITETGNFAWFDENLQTNRGTFRGSGVLEKTENNWKLKHYVLSVPIPNDDMKEVVKITRKNDSIFQLKFK